MKPTLSLFLIFAPLACLITNASAQVAQVTVVEAGAQSQQAISAPLSNNAAAVNASNNDVVMSLYLQLETLQQEVQSIRGLLEEQSYQIRRMESEQRDRYIDIDGRLSGISTPVSSSSTNVGVTSAVGGGNIPEDSGYLLPAVISAQNLDEAQAPVPKSEQEVYRSALNLLLEESEYEASISLFQEYIDSYPEGRYLTNAYYWQGEAFILAKHYAKAKDVFLQIISEFPEDPKSPGAMLKLGVAYKQLGDIELATQTWSNLSVEYPENSTEIRAAEDYLRRAENDR